MNRLYLLLTAALLLGGCGLAHPDAEETLHLDPPTMESTELSLPETQPMVETGTTETQPVETVDMSSMMEEASIQIIATDGMIGDYDFFTCNETQLFGDFSISLVDYDGETYQMLSYNGIALLAKEDGSQAKLFYNDRHLDLPFSCYFNLDYEFLALHPGDFLKNGSRQLALIIPVATGSGLDIDELQIIDLDTMSLVPLHTQQEDYSHTIHQLFDDHFAQTHPGLTYELFQYVKYPILDGLIFVEYGACDEDGNYLCFLEGSLSYDGSQMNLDPQMTFQDHMN